MIVYHTWRNNVVRPKHNSNRQTQSRKGQSGVRDTLPHDDFIEGYCGTGASDTETIGEIRRFAARKEE